MSSAGKTAKRPKPPAVAAAAALASARRKRTLEGLVMGPPAVYAEVTPKPALIHKTFILPRDSIEASNTIMIGDKLAWNQIAR
jgi:hypothetical protein